MGKTLLIFTGVLICAIGNVFFAIPNHITAGGITGLSTLLYYWFNWNMGVVYFLLNVPLFLIAWRFSKSLFFQSISGMLLCSIMIGLLTPLSEVYGVKHLWEGSCFGGLVMGLGLGILGFANASLGGGSLTGKILNMKYGFSFSLSTMLIDASVLPFAWFGIGAHQTLFSIIFVVSSAFGIRIVDFSIRSIWTAKNIKLSGDKS
ncbi:YitT family protein [Paenibacillus solisilvae]|uniref:YitT family protein n=1 Tax=Paenibacillus solisilvae TaxID=2486751 RepID=A0ABW0W548_9BACL